MNKLMNKQQLAEYLGMSVGWVEKATAARELPIVPIGRHIKYDPADIDAWIAERKEPAITTPPTLALVRRGHPPSGPSTPPPPSGPRLPRGRVA